MQRLTAEQKSALRAAAEKARAYAYAPYSDFCVGAALLGENGQIYTGCNIESAAYTPTVCAERVAVFKAVSEGVCRFAAIAVAGGQKDAPLPLPDCSPCGVCRQVLTEFCPPSLPVLTATGETTLGALLPEAFGPDSLHTEKE